MDQKTSEGRRLSGQDTFPLRATQNDLSGLYQGEAFVNALADSTLFAFLPGEVSASPRSFHNVGNQLATAGQVRREQISG